MAENHPQERFTVLEGDALADMDTRGAALLAHQGLNGCFTIAPDVALCYRFDPPFRMRVCLVVHGREVVCEELSVDQCVTLEVTLLLLKVRLEVCFVDDDGRLCLTSSGRICVWAGSWHCVERSDTIICIGPV
jgi:hypothetical protein